ncbi:hypothetical protein SAMN04490247_2483 [Salimicrobium halophilum]|uniref:Uncharacterized protein n=1 Tax=Salimicrobium halophilum TaxID=86666 RepID=A0A1G8V4A1_9BACI|nr:hypothetical protein SAMN04490247_2483 [Salimicrobium halophilum]
MLGSDVIMMKDFLNERKREKKYGKVYNNEKYRWLTNDRNAGSIQDVS